MINLFMIRSFPDALKMHTKERVEEQQQQQDNRKEYFSTIMFTLMLNIISHVILNQLIYNHIWDSYSQSDFVHQRINHIL